MSKMGKFVNRNFDSEDAEEFRDLEDEEASVELNVSESYQAAKLIIGERGAPK